MSIWNENINGPLSNSVGSPTVVTLNNGNGSVIASVGGGNSDYFTFTVGNNQILNKIFLRGYSSSDNVAWLAIQSGPTWTAGDNPGLMLANQHFGPGNINQEILGGASPYNPGNYTVRVQQLGSNTNYTLEFQVLATDILAPSAPLTPAWEPFILTNPSFLNLPCYNIILKDNPGCNSNQPPWFGWTPNCQTIYLNCLNSLGENPVKISADGGGFKNSEYAIMSYDRTQYFGYSTIQPLGGQLNAATNYINFIGKAGGKITIKFTPNSSNLNYLPYDIYLRLAAQPFLSCNECSESNRQDICEPYCIDTNAWRRDQDLQNAQPKSGIAGGRFFCPPPTSSSSCKAQVEEKLIEISNIATGWQDFPIVHSHLKPTGIIIDDDLICAYNDEGKWLCEDEVGQRSKTPWVYKQKLTVQDYIIISGQSILIEDTTFNIINPTGYVAFYSESGAINPYQEIVGSGFINFRGINTFNFGKDNSDSFQITFDQFTINSAISNNRIVRAPINNPQQGKINIAKTSLNILNPSSSSSSLTSSSSSSLALPKGPGGNMWNYGLYNLQPPGLLAAYPRCEIISERFDYDKGVGDIVLVVNSQILKIIGEKTLSLPGSAITTKVLTMSYSSYFSISVLIALDVDLRCLEAKGIDPVGMKSFDDWLPCKGTGFTDQQAGYYIYSMGGCSKDTIIGTRMHRDLYGSLGAKKRDGDVMCGGGGIAGGKGASTWWKYTTNPCKWCCDSQDNPGLINQFLNETWEPYKSYCPDFNTFSTFRPIYETYKLNSLGKITKINLPINLDINIKSLAEKLNVDYLAVSMKDS